jgi:hypothetical protein
MVSVMRLRVASSLLATTIAAATMLIAAQASACEREKPERESCDPLFVPRLAATPNAPLVWALASYDERRQALVAYGVPHAIASEIAIGGVPLSGQRRSSEPGWYLVPGAGSLRLQARFWKP